MAHIVMAPARLDGYLRKSRMKHFAPFLRICSEGFDSARSHRRSSANCGEPFAPHSEKRSSSTITPRALGSLTIRVVSSIPLIPHTTCNRATLAQPSQL